jgi:hypothetical protein
MVVPRVNLNFRQHAYCTNKSIISDSVHWNLVDQEYLNLGKTGALDLVAHVECGNIAEQKRHLSINNKNNIQQYL